MPDLFGSTMGGDPAGLRQIYGIQNRYDYGHLSPELAQAERKQDQRQLVANAIMQGALKPRQGKMVGRLYQKAHIGEGLGQIGEALIGGWMAGDIEDKRTAAENANTKKVADAISKFQSSIEGEPSGTITRAAEKEVPGNLNQVLSATQAGSPDFSIPPMTPNQVQTRNYSRLTGTEPSSEKLFQEQADPSANYVMGSPALPERTEESPGTPVSERNYRQAMAELYKDGSDPAIKSFIGDEKMRRQNEILQARQDARYAITDKREDAHQAAIDLKEYNANRAVNDQLAQRASEQYDIKRYHEHQLYLEGIKQDEEKRRHLVDEAEKQEYHRGLLAQKNAKLKMLSNYQQKKRDEMENEVFAINERIDAFKGFLEPSEVKVVDPKTRAITFSKTGPSTNDRAFSVAPETLSFLSNVTGTNQDAYEASELMSREFGEAALSRLKATFGGNPSNVEGQWLKGLTDYSTMRPDKRANFIRRGIELLERRVAQDKRKLRQIGTDLDTDSEFLAITGGLSNAEIGFTGTPYKERPPATEPPNVIRDSTGKLLEYRASSSNNWDGYGARVK